MRPVSTENPGNKWGKKQLQILGGEKRGMGHNPELLDWGFHKRKGERKTHRKTQQGGWRDGVKLKIPTFQRIPGNRKGKNATGKEIRCGKTEHPGLGEGKERGRYEKERGHRLRGPKGTEGGPIFCKKKIKIERQEERKRGAHPWTPEKKKQNQPF